MACVFLSKTSDHARAISPQAADGQQNTGAVAGRVGLVADSHLEGIVHVQDAQTQPCTDLENCARRGARAGRRAQGETADTQCAASAGRTTDDNFACVAHDRIIYRAYLILRVSLVLMCCVKTMLGEFLSANVATPFLLFMVKSTCHRLAIELC